MGAPCSHASRCSSPLASRGVWHSGHLATSLTRYFPRSTSLFSVLRKAPLDISAETSVTEASARESAATTLNPFRLVRMSPPPLSRAKHARSSHHSDARVGPVFSFISASGPWHLFHVPPRDQWRLLVFCFSRLRPCRLFLIARCRAFCDALLS